MAAPILVTGGTGTLGGMVVAQLRDAGHTVRVLSRSERETANGIEFVAGDLATGEGVDAAVRGIATIVHCAGSAKGDELKAANLVKAASKADVTHLVYISVVGADRVPQESGIDRTAFGYYGSKRAAELIVANSGIPYTTLRATQFHELTLVTAEAMAKLPVVPVPSGFWFQPVAASEVADRMVELALGEPAGLVDDIGGPRVYTMTELVRSYLRAAGKRRPIIHLRMPGKAARALRDGVNLAPERAVGTHTWEEFLAQRVDAVGKPESAAA